MTGFDGPLTSHGHDGTYGPGSHPLPVYRPSYVYVCPGCDGDLQHEGADSYWCTWCRRTLYFTEVGCYDEGDYERD